MVVIAIEQAENKLQILILAANKEGTHYLGDIARVPRVIFNLKPTKIVRDIRNCCNGRFPPSDGAPTPSIDRVMNVDT